MAVDIQSERHRRMPQIGGDCLDVRSLLKSKRRISMPQIVEPDIREVGRPRAALEVLIERTLGKMMAEFIFKT